jgi:hypothetical protein
VISGHVDVRIQPAHPAPDVVRRRREDAEPIGEGQVILTDLFVHF